MNRRNFLASILATGIATSILPRKALGFMGKMSRTPGGLYVAAMAQYGADKDSISLMTVDDQVEAVQPLEFDKWFDGTLANKLVTFPTHSGGPVTISHAVIVIGGMATYLPLSAFTLDSGVTPAIQSGSIKVG